MLVVWWCGGEVVVVVFVYLGEHGRIHGFMAYFNMSGTVAPPGQDWPIGHLHIRISSSQRTKYTCLLIE